MNIPKDFGSLRAHSAGSSLVDSYFKEPFHKMINEQHPTASTSEIFYEDNEDYTDINSNRRSYDDHKDRYGYNVIPRSVYHKNQGSFGGHHHGGYGCSHDDSSTEELLAVAAILALLMMTLMMSGGRRRRRKREEEDYHWMDYLVSQMIWTGSTKPCDISHMTIGSLFKNGLGPHKTKSQPNTYKYCMGLYFFPSYKVPILFLWPLLR